MAFTNVTVTGTFHKADGSLATGSVLARPSTELQNGTTVIDTTASVGAIVNGALSMVLVATDDTGTTPGGAYYTFIVQYDGQGIVESFTAPLSHLTSPVDFATFAPIVTSPPLSATFSLGALDARYAPITVTNQVFNVLAYGADRTGVTNTVAACQAAVTACSAAGGGTVYFPSGIYSFQSALSVPNFVCLLGDGQASQIAAVGNVFAINLNPANRVRISNLAFSAASLQASGGAIDFTNAANNVWLSDLWFGSNLFISVNVKPAAAGGIHIFERLRWNGVTGCNTAFAIGDGTHLVTDIYMSEISGTAATIADMANWFTILKSVDTVQIVNSLFVSGSKGMTFGASGSGDVTNCKFTGVVFDGCDLQAFDIQSCRGMTFANCNAQGCGTSALPGVDIGASAKSVSWVGGDIHENRSDGVRILNGSNDINIVGALIRNNNTTNQGFGSGVTVSANTTHWSVVGCSIGNLIGAGLSENQKYGVLIGGGTSTDYMIANNRFFGNVTASYLNSTVTGAAQQVSGNIPEVVNTIASATTTTLPAGPMVIVSGTTTITSVTASHVGRVVTLKFSGALTFTDGSNLVLAGNFVTTADDTITLVCDGANWIEVARSVN